MKKLVQKIKLAYNMRLITGLHIGDSSENVEIGGIDNPIVRRRIDGVPYVPGSSIKGKMRCLLEQIAGATEVGADKDVNFLFGSVTGEGVISRLIVRDSYLEPKSEEGLKNSTTTDMPYSEIKMENSIHRVEGKGENPRLTERIPAGVVFQVEFVVNVWDDDKDGETCLRILHNGIRALENDYLGGSGSRGYGQVAFEETNRTTIDLTIL